MCRRCAIWGLDSPPVDARVVLSQPPQGHRQPETRLRGLSLAVGQHRLEGRTRLPPSALSKGGETVSEWFLRCHYTIVSPTNGLRRQPIPGPAREDSSCAGRFC